MFTQHYDLTIGNVQAHVAEAGAGPPIVFLHGNPDTHALWGSIVQHLAAKHRCVAPDLPGFGKSRAPSDYDCSLENQAAFVRGLVDALGLDRVHLVVHDVGGTYGLSFASLHPERLRSLTIFNVNHFPDYRYHFWARVWRTPVLGELSLAIMNRPLFVREMRRGSPRMPRAYADHAYDAFGRDAKHMVLRWYRYMDPERWSGWDAKLLAATASTPKLVLWGDLDPFLPKHIAERYEAEVRHFADCGHWVMAEEPEAAATALAAHVAKYA